MIEPISRIIGIDSARGDDVTVYGKVPHIPVIDEIHEYSTPQEARQALINMDMNVMNDALSGG